MKNRFSPPHLPLVSGLLLTLGLSVLPIGWAQEGPLDTTLPPTKAKSGKQQPMPARLKKRELVGEVETAPLMKEITALDWDHDETEDLGLEDVFKRSLENNPTLKQAEERIHEAELKGKEIRRPNGFFFLIPPMDSASLKRAAEENTDSARSLYQAAIQKTLLDSAQMYGALTKAYLNKYVSYQMIQQGKAQLKANQERFISGEVNRFDVTQAEMTLIDRYQKYLTADNLYTDASESLAAQLSISNDDQLVPKGVSLKNELGVEALSLIPPQLTEDGSARVALKSRPEIQALRSQYASLEKLAKAASGDDKKMLESDLRQLEFEVVKTERFSGVSARQAFQDYTLARKNTELANQQFRLASNFLRQLEISHQAGFSSSKDVLDGQVEWAKAKANAINSMVDYNLSQIKLLHELGLLRENVLKEPIRLDQNLL